jgi:SAM-dependent methyltransferase
MDNFVYVGTELELFSQARNWKSYYRELLRPYLGPRVLEVGAGIGETTRHLSGTEHEQWTCLEPDRRLADRIESLQASGDLPAFCHTVVGTTADLDPAEEFDSILYMDVLEHIDEDRAEVARVIPHLAPGGFLIVLAPAHNWLFTPFDAQIGHFRRYTRGTLQAAVGSELRCVSVRYLDSAGLLASLGNRLVLNSKMPTPKQIRIWDRLLVPISRILDRAFAYRVGKSVLGIWENVAVPALAKV